MHVCVIGAGYVGLVSGLGLAAKGHQVTCVDADPAKVAAITAGHSPIFEAGLDELLRAHVGQGFTVTTDLAAAATAAEVTLLCVGTPSAADGSIDTTALRRAADQVGAALALRPAGGPVPVVVVKSTVVPGTTDDVVAAVVAEASGLVPGVGVGIGVNPEFLTEGRALADFTAPDRIVIGGEALALAALRELYAGFVGVPLVETTTRTAELIKYASNAMLATAISFANEIATIADAVGGIDTAAVMRGVHASRYLTTAGPAGPVVAELASFFESGCGYGGSCLPKDVAALAAHGRARGVETRLLDAVAAVNDAAPGRMVALVHDRLGSLEGRAVTVLGLAFKPDTDDVRCSPAVPVLRGLLDAGAVVVAHDPIVGPDTLAAMCPDVTGRLSHIADLETAVKGADAIVIVTTWAEYWAVPGLVADSAPVPLVVDGRRMLDPRSVIRYAAPGLSVAGG